MSEYCQEEEKDVEVVLSSGDSSASIKLFLQIASLANGAFLALHSTPFNMANSLNCIFDPGKFASRQALESCDEMPNSLIR